ncbi:hypothetical protein KM043_007711 [Ampulex compressa]|nr:hypothetical protein KM043_007711 [Ampulex compressa]
MLLSHDMHPGQENCEISWNQLADVATPYKPNRAPRRRDNKDGDAKYVCNKCGNTYKAITSLSRHKRLECGVLPCEVCPICDRRFKHKFVLNSHVVRCQRKRRHVVQKRSDSPCLGDEDK